MSQTDFPFDPQFQTPPAKPNGALWLYYLYFKPRLFFRHFAMDAMPILTVICAWLYGMVMIIDRMDGRGGDAFRLAMNSWRYYAMTVVIGGIFAGILYYALGGWWYRVRLQLAGAVEPDPYLARRVLLYASQVIVIPVIVVTLLEARHFATPLEALHGRFYLWQLLPILFIFWSIPISYLGATTAFELSRGKAVFWFLIAPAIIYLLFIGGAFAVGYMQVMAPPDIDNPIRHQSRHFSFSYPGNWWIETAHDERVVITAAQDVYITLEIYESDLTPAQEMDVTLDHLPFDDARTQSDFTGWGRLEGTGLHLTAEINGIPIHHRIFITRMPHNRMLEITESVAHEDHDLVAAGLHLIRSTFHFR